MEGTAIRQCTETDIPAMLAIVNDAAEAYRGAIPEDCWHEPYMSEEELRGELAAGVRFWAWTGCSRRTGSFPIGSERLRSCWCGAEEGRNHESIDIQASERLASDRNVVDCRGIGIRLPAHLRYRPRSRRGCRGAPLAAAHVGA